MDRQKNLGLCKLTTTGASPSFQKNDYFRADQHINIREFPTGRRINDRDVGFDSRSGGQPRL